MLQEKQSEKNLQSKCIAKLNSTPGVWVVKTITTNKAGVPDIISCINGTFVAFEVKRKGQNCTPLQEYNGQKIINSGGIWHKIDDFKEFTEILGRILTKTGNPNQK